MILGLPNFQELLFSVITGMLRSKVRYVRVPLLPVTTFKIPFTVVIINVENSSDVEQLCFYYISQHSCGQSFTPAQSFFFTSFSIIIIIIKKKSLLFEVS